MSGVVKRISFFKYLFYTVLQASFRAAIFPLLFKTSTPQQLSLSQKKMNLVHNNNISPNTYSLPLPLKPLLVRIENTKYVTSLFY